MKYFYQFTVILAVSWAGEFLHALLPFPFPASIYGLVLMLILLKFGVIRMDHVKETGHFLLETMPCMFIPPAVGLLKVVSEVSEMLVPLVVIVLVSTVVVMAATGKTADFIIDRAGKKSAGEEAKA